MCYENYFVKQPKYVLQHLNFWYILAHSYALLSHNGPQDNSLDILNLTERRSGREGEESDDATDATCVSRGEKTEFHVFHQFNFRGRTNSSRCADSKCPKAGRSLIGWSWQSWQSRQFDIVVSKMSRELNFKDLRGLLGSRDIEVTVVSHRGGTSCVLIRGFPPLSMLLMRFRFRELL